MKKYLLLCCLLLSLPTAALAENEKINPKTFICAELVALPTTSGIPPLFEILQVDGFVSAGINQTVPAPEQLAPMLGQMFNACQARPTAKVQDLWKELKKAYTPLTEGPWDAAKTTCKDYAANEEDGSGFMIWLDGYQRGKSGKPASVLDSDDTVKAYLDACAQKPDALMLDVMKERTK